jgi:hypothetical protein
MGFTPCFRFQFFVAKYATMLFGLCYTKVLASKNNDFSDVVWYFASWCKKIGRSPYVYIKRKLSPFSGLSLLLLRPPFRSYL